MFPANSREPEYFSNPYESFMRRHLQHYGYYTGRNQNYRNGFQAYKEWEKTYGYSVSSDSSDSDSDSDDENQKTRDNRLQEELQRTTQVIYNYESGRMVPKLREPRNLYALNKELGPQQAARWPAEVQVMDEKVYHIRYVPPEPEPFYKPTGMEKMPMSRGEENGTVVFEYEVKTSFYVRSRVGGARGGCDDCSYTPTSKEDTTLVFESRFESGNLARAVKVNECDYELWLRYDLYTTKHTQWFYFSLSNTRSNVKYRITIVNLMKPDSLYNYGMKPLMYSETEAQLHKVGWVRGGSDIKYYKNNLRHDTAKGSFPLYSLTWTFECKHNMDTVYFAHCYPYTYTDLQDYLLDISNDPIKSRICKQRVLCRSLAGNLVYILTITSPSLNPEDMKPANKDRDPHKHKKAVVLTSRVHPGESNASWMMKGFLDYLTGNSADAKLLRDNFIFKIIPMLNPDGVIVGNYRCSLAGRDLNRNYKTVLKDAYPSVWHTKNMIKRLLQERDIIVYCDLHGHSRRQNVFIYGCENRHNPQRRLRERIFPSMLNKNTPDKFSFDACKFRVQKGKEGTGRIVMWNMGIMNSYTMEATFCGSSMGKKKGFHFSVADFESMGYHFCDTLLDYCDPDNTKSTNVLVELEEKVKQEIMVKMGKEGMSPTDIDLSDYSSDMISSDDGGSDSSGSDGPPVHLQYAANSRAAAKPSKKKKKLKSKRERDKQHPLKEEVPVKKTQGPQTDAASDKKAGVPAGSSHKGEKHDCLSHVRFSTPKRPRSQDDRTNNGIPTFVQERFEERQQRRNEYLEALTAAYLQHGIPLVKDPVFVKLDPKKVSSFRYSSSDRPPPTSYPVMEGLCPHHEQTFAAQYVSNQLQNRGNEGADRLRDSTAELTSADARGNSFFKIWQLHPIRKNVFDDYMKSMARQGTVAPLDRNKSRHLLEISALQQRQQDYLTHYGSSNLGADKGKLIKQHPNPFDEKNQGKRAKLPWPKGQNPSATYMSYDPDKIVLVGGAESLRSRPEPSALEGEMEGELPRSTRQRSGRKSRMSLHEEDMETGSRPMSSNQLLDLTSTYSRPVPRIKSAHVTEEMASAMNSIQNMRESVSHVAPPASPPVDGNYINQLMDETSEQIASLTSEIQGEIEKEKKLVREHMARDQGSQKEGPRLVSRAVETRNLSMDPVLGSSRASRQAPSPMKGDEVASLHGSGLRGQEMYLLQQESLTPLHIQRPASTNSMCGRDPEPYQGPDSRAESSRSRSARSGRQVIETVPTKISLMICSGHHHQGQPEQSPNTQFLPMYRTVRPHFLRQQGSRRK